MTLSQALRRAALGPLEQQQSLSGLLGYMTKCFVVVFIRLPTPYPLAHWDLATDTERRMFLLFVSEALKP